MNRTHQIIIRDATEAFCAETNPQEMVARIRPLITLGLLGASEDDFGITARQNILEGKAAAGLPEVQDGLIALGGLSVLVYTYYNERSAQPTATYLGAFERMRKFGGNPRRQMRLELGHLVPRIDATDDREGAVDMWSMGFGASIISAMDLLYVSPMITWKAFRQYRQQKRH